MASTKRQFAIKGKSLWEKANSISSTLIEDFRVCQGNILEIRCKYLHKNGNFPFHLSVAKLDLNPLNLRRDEGLPAATKTML
jgi:hypothetical protein